MTRPQLDLLAACLLAAASCVAIWDVLYLHVHTYKLHLNVASSVEHRLHTWQLFLNGISIILLFVGGPAGFVLWCALATVVAGSVVEVLDALCEKRSRSALGGLSSGEYALHVLGASLRAAAFVLIIVTTPLELWRASASGFVVVRRPTPVAVMGWLFGVGALVAAVHHILVAAGRPRRT